MLVEKERYVSPLAEIVCVVTRQAILEGSMRGENAGDEENPGY